MNISFFLARFFGLYFVIVGFFYLSRRRFIKKAVEAFYENSPLLLISGVISLIIGLLLVLTHSVWEFNWRVVITIIGYLTLLKGLSKLFVPMEKEKKWILKLVTKDNPIYIGLICLIIGFFLIYEGFFETL